MIVDISGTRLAWATISEWCAVVMDEGSRLHASTDNYLRLTRLYRSLTIDRIRASRDQVGLHRAARMFDLGRHNPVPGFYTLARVFTRAGMGTMLVELRNRRAAVISGHAMFPRAKGPRLDPARLTDAALDRLIQSHPDLTLVERLRNERELRAVDRHRPCGTSHRHPRRTGTMSAPTAQPIVIGTRIHTNLYARGYGTVFAIHGEQAPASVRSIAGVIATGGRAAFDIVFDCGSFSKQLPECILRGVQWRVLDETVTAPTIAAAIAFAAAEQIRLKAEAAAAKQ